MWFFGKNPPSPSQVFLDSEGPKRIALHFGGENNVTQVFSRQLLGDFKVEMGFLNGPFVSMMIYKQRVYTESSEPECIDGWE